MSIQHPEITSADLAEIRGRLEAEAQARSQLLAEGDADGELEEGLRLTAEQFVADLRDAIERIDDGRYGFCEACGGAIAAARLEAVPTAAQCVSCVDRPLRPLGR